MVLTDSSVTMPDFISYFLIWACATVATTNASAANDKASFLVMVIVSFELLVFFISQTQEPYTS
jgi:hypothetical protein